MSLDPSAFHRGLCSWLSVYSSGVISSQHSAFSLRASWAEGIQQRWHGCRKFNSICENALTTWFLIRVLSREFAAKICFLICLFLRNAAERFHPISLP